jgi:hypothetical protein
MQHSVHSDDVTLESLGMLLCFSASQYHVGWSFGQMAILDHFV